MKLLLKVIEKLKDGRKSYILRTAEINGAFPVIQEKEMTLEELEDCINISIKSECPKREDGPKGYFSAKNSLGEYIDFRNLSDSNFFVTNIYYDENNKPQLYRSIDVMGNVSVNDISEWKYYSHLSILGPDLNRIAYMKQIYNEPVRLLYHWWGTRADRSKTFADSFMIDDKMPVKVLYHYLVGVLGFKIGYSSILPADHWDGVGEVREYMLIKGSANVKLMEVVEEETDELTSYPRKRTVGFAGFKLSFLCPKDKELSDKKGIVVEDYSRKYNEVALEKCPEALKIFKEFDDRGLVSQRWGLGYKNRISKNLMSNLLPLNILLLNSVYEFKKWTSYNLGGTIPKMAGWIKAVSIANCMQFYSQSLSSVLNPIIKNYPYVLKYYFIELLNSLGPKKTQALMNWLYKSLIKELGNIRVSDGLSSYYAPIATVVNTMSELFNFKKNDLNLPDWLRIYSVETIESIGGEEFIWDLIGKLGEVNAKRSLIPLIEKIEEENADIKPNVYYGNIL